MSDCTIAAQVLEKREEPAEYLVDRMIRIWPRSADVANTTDDGAH